MATDIFGYDKTSYGPGHVVSSNMVLFSIDSTDVRLAQSVQIGYNRNGSPVYEMGSSSVWLIGGQSAGTVSVSRAVGEQKLLQPYKPSDPCATQTLAIGRGVDNCGMDPGNIICVNSLLTSVGFSSSSGGTVVTDSAQWFVGLLTQ